MQASPNPPLPKRTKISVFRHTFLQVSSVIIYLFLKWMVLSLTLLCGHFFICRWILNCYLLNKAHSGELPTFRILKKLMNLFLWFSYIILGILCINWTFLFFFSFGAELLSKLLKDNHSVHLLHVILIHHLQKYSAYCMNFENTKRSASDLVFYQENVPKYVSIV